MKRVYPEQSRGGFALLYVILFAGLISIAVATIAASLAANIRLTAKTAESAQAYQLARSGIEDALAQYQMTTTHNCNTILNYKENGNVIYQYIMCDRGSDRSVEAWATYKNSTIKLKAEINGNTTDQTVANNGEKIYQVGN